MQSEKDLSSVPKHERIKIWLDDENQIVRQVFTGPFIDESDVQFIEDETQRCVDRMKDPRNVYLLIDGSNLDKGSPGTRKKLMVLSNRENLKKAAVWGNVKPIVAAIVNFINIITGKQKTRIFSTEHDALAWLRERP